MQAIPCVRQKQCIEMKGPSMKRTSILLSAIVLIGCNLPDDTESTDQDQNPKASVHKVTRNMALASSPPKAVPDSDSDSDSDSSPVSESGIRHLAQDKKNMPNAHSAFEEVIDLLNEHYVDGPLDEDALWTAATHGVLQRLIQLGDHRINALLSPEELKELETGTSGKIVGIGVAIELVAGTLVLREVFPDSPSAVAGLQAGDRILAIDAVRTTGLDLPTLAHKIRGAIGTKTSLFVQRDTEEWTVEIKRDEIKFSSVDGRMIGESMAYLRIGSFSKRTPEDVDAQLKSLDNEGMRSLIIDVRGCPGGLLDTSIQVAHRFLAPGLRVASVRQRNGEEKVFDTSTEYPWQSLPVAMLIGPHTASGAEILAMAMAHHNRAVLVGEPTLGKGTVETIHALGNKWGLKLSTGRFFGPTTDRQHGEAIHPDLQIKSTGKPPKSTKQLDVENDVVLEAARQLLRAQMGK